MKQFFLVFFILQVSVFCHAGQQNGVIFMVDDMRFDQMSLAGRPYFETPTLDALAGEGTLFSRAYVTSPLCGPSRASFYAGRLPSEHERYNKLLYPPPFDPYLPDAFRKAGYATAMIGKFYERPGEGTAAVRARFDRWVRSAGADWSLFEGDLGNSRERQQFYDALHMKLEAVVRGRRPLPGPAKLNLGFYEDTLTSRDH